jgi:hypothetical protein
MDFFLLGHIKYLIYTPPVEDFTVRIVEEAAI